MLFRNPTKAEDFVKPLKNMRSVIGIVLVLRAIHAQYLPEPRTIMQ